jgi:hypothetical protein
MPSEGLKIAIPLMVHDERRRSERFIASMPVNIEGREGTTNDLSTTGLSFHSDRPYEPGSRLEVVIEYLLDGHNYPLKCEVEVVRSEAQAEGFTIGARLAPRSELVEVPVAEPENEPAAGPATRAPLRRVD